MGQVESNNYHIVNMDDINYSMWIPHACLTDRYGDNKSRNVCFCDNSDSIIHNYKDNKHFFINSFAVKWEPLHYLRTHYFKWNTSIIDCNINVDDLMDSSEDDG